MNVPTSREAPQTPAMDAAELYLDLLKRSVTRANAPTDPLVEVVPHKTLSKAAYRLARPLLAGRGFRLAVRKRVPPEAFELGMNEHPEAETMIGLKRLDNIQKLVVEALRDGVPGDLVETGIWRGGATIFMRGILKAYDVTDRVVWAADSFEGLPEPDPARYPADGEAWMWKDGKWAADLTVSLDEVRSNFERYGLLDDQVRFLVGWFKDTLPNAPIERIAVLRMDGDLYESTMQTLEALYPKVSVGGSVIVDDYGAWEPCKKAVDEYRARHGIADEIHWIDWTGAWWRKSGEGSDAATGD